MKIRELRPICPKCCCVHSIRMPPVVGVQSRTVDCMNCGEKFKTDIPNGGEWTMKQSSQVLFGRQ